MGLVVGFAGGGGVVEGSEVAGGLSRHLLL